MNTMLFFDVQVPYFAAGNGTPPEPDFLNGPYCETCRRQDGSVSISLDFGEEEPYEFCSLECLTSYAAALCMEDDGSNRYWGRIIPPGFTASADGVDPNTVDKFPNDPIDKED